MDRETALLLKMLDEAFDRRAWHGPTLLGAVRGVDATTALWRPAPGRHSIWEIVLHCAYWKHRVRQRLGAGADAFPRPGRDWPRLPEPAGEQAWRADLRLLRDEHRRLRDVVVGLPAESLHTAAPGRKRPPIAHIHGIAAHDLYHAGQLRLLSRLAAISRVRSGAGD